jgi:hypothetical protein
MWRFLVPALAVTVALTILFADAVGDLSRWRISPIAQS